MISSVSALPTHLKKGYQLGKNLRNHLNTSNESSRTFSKIYVGGMGGSAFPAEIARLLTNQAGVPLDICRNYRFSLPLDEHTLVCLCSFSGNTEETLSLLDQVLQIRKKEGTQIECVVLTSGGLLLAKARQHALPCIVFEKPSKTFQPRAASGLFLGALVWIFQYFFPSFDPPLWSETIEDLSSYFTNAPLDSHFQEQVQRYTNALHKRIPIFYAPTPLGSALAQVLKIKINENAKSPAFWNELPEYNHNELAGFTHTPSLFKPVFLKPPFSWISPPMNRRFDASLHVLKEAGHDPLMVEIQDSLTLWGSCLKTYYLFDFISCELALKLDENPNPVHLIESFKGLLKS